MKPNSIKKRAYSQGVWFFMFLFLIGALTFAWGSDKLTKSRLNEKYRDAAREMKECYYNGDLERVIDLFYKNCRKHEGAKPIEEKKEFKRVKKEIRANIYQWVALSYFKLDKLEVGDTYLGKLYNESKAQLNETFRDIAKETKEYYDSGQLKNVINLYKKYCLKDKGKAGKEKKEFKKVSGEIRADIYQWLALSYDMLDEPEMRDIYLKKLLDIRNGLGAGNYWPSIRNVAEEKYEVAPRLLLGAKLGTNFTLAHPFNRFEVLKPAAETGWNSYHKDYSSNLADSLGMEAGIIVEYALTRNLSVCIQPASIDLRFQYKNNFIWVREVGGEPMMVNYTHRQKFYYIEIPFLLKYRFVNIKSKLKPYLQIGGFYRFLQFAHKSIDISLLETQETTKDLNLKNLITRTSSGILVGAGIGYDIGGLRLEIGLNYKHAFNNIVNGDYRYENAELMFGYYDVFDDIKIRNWGLSLNVLLPISFKAFEK